MKEKKAVYKITKDFRNASDIYYIKIYPSQMCEELLHSIGEHTDGGHSYGYGIKARKINRLPKGAKLLKRVFAIY